MSDENNQTGGGQGTGAGPTPGGVSPAIIDLSNISTSAPASNNSLPTVAPTSALPVSDAATTPAVDPKIATEFGLDADKLAEIAKKYTIPESVKTQFPDLVALLVKTESMNDEERDYWFQVLPIMTEEQIVKLRTILVNERDQLKKIDNEYDTEMKKLNDVHKNEWNSFEAQQKKAVRVQAEASHEATESSHEEDLLKKLGEIDNAA